MNIPFVDLARQFSSLKPELLDAFSEVGKSGIYVLGERLNSFEKKM